MPFTRNPLTDPNLVKTLMGWNQLVEIDTDASGNFRTLRVSDYEMGSRQTGDAPDYVTGASDRTAWTKGPVEIEGTISYPYTFNQANTVSGHELFVLGADLCKDISQNFSIRSSASEEVAGCKIATTTLSCNAGEPVQCNSSIWGISTSEDNVSNIDGTQNDETSGASSVNYSDGATGLVGEPEGDTDGQNDLRIVQIPMWDACQIIGAPDGMFVTAWSIQIDNALQRNYTMGNEDGASPWGLNPSSITASQRRVTGTITWQSDSDGKLDVILSAGIKELEILIADAVSLTLVNCLWNAVPPRLATGDRVTCESSFTAIGSGGSDNEGFDALDVESSV